ncbi:MAG TPA: hypothetical protein VF668_00605 [Pyrinomonadaceae bacterium]|jgi:hypothetical protein
MMRAGLTAILISISILFACALCAGAGAAGGLAGRWKLDPARSEGLPPGMRQLMAVSQEGDVVRLETTLITDEGEQVVPDSYTLDGREAEFAPKGPQGQTGKGRRTARWTADRKGVEVDEQVTFDSPEGPVTIKTSRRWSLTDDNTLVIQMKVEGPHGQQLLKRTFVRE